MLDLFFDNDLLAMRAERLAAQDSVIFSNFEIIAIELA